MNTATPEVLAAVIGGLNLGTAQWLVVQRDRAYYRSADDFARRLPREATLTMSDITVSSNYFLATLRVAIGGAQARGEALFARQGAGWPVIVWRKLL